MNFWVARLGTNIKFIGSGVSLHQRTWVFHLLVQQKDTWLSKVMKYWSLFFCVFEGSLTHLYLPLPSLFTSGCDSLFTCFGNRSREWPLITISWDRISLFVVVFTWFCLESDTFNLLDKHYALLISLPIPHPPSMTSDMKSVMFQTLAILLFLTTGELCSIILTTTPITIHFNHQDVSLRDTLIWIPKRILCRKSWFGAQSLPKNNRNASSGLNS